MQPISKLFFSCIFCFAFILSTGCGNKNSSTVPPESDAGTTETTAKTVPTMTTEEQAEADKKIARVGKDAGTTEATTETVPTLTAEEQAAADQRITRAGKDAALQQYLLNSLFGNPDENLVIRHIQYFVSQGSDIHAKDNNGSTVLHTAAGLGKLEVVKFLISQGADVHVKRIGDVTPLMEAVVGPSEAGGNVEVVKFLVSQGADVHAKNARGITVLDMAKQRKNAAVTEYLESLK